MNIRFTRDLKVTDVIEADIRNRIDDSGNKRTLSESNLKSKKPIQVFAIQGSSYRDPDEDFGVILQNWTLETFNENGM